MKRRKFLIAGSLGIIMNACASISRIIQSTASVYPAETLQPTIVLAEASTPAPAQTPLAARTAAATVGDQAPLSTATGTVTPVDTEEVFLPVSDDFTGTAGAPGRSLGADSAGQIAITDGELQITGKAPGENDPSIYADRLIRRSEGQVAGARFKAAYGKGTGRIGLETTDFQPMASVRRSTAEREGGVIECGSRSFPVLDLYSGCWYDSVVFLQNSGAAFALNDGAGLELVMVSEEGSAKTGHIGYWSTNGMDQGASIDAWYAPGERHFPPALVSQLSAGADYEADAGTNAAWVEAQIDWADGAAGLRIRSIDRDNEYRVYLDGEHLKVDQVIKGSATSISAQDMAPIPGAKLSARYNELTLTVYYNGVVTSTLNRKIGAPALMAGTNVGIYSTFQGNTFTHFTARAVRIDVPEFLSSRLLNSRQVLCLGDSLTNADKAFGYQNSLRKRLGDAWVTVDCGVSGQTTYQMLSRLPSHLRRYHPEVVVVLGGTNDIDNHGTTGSIISSLQEIYRTAKQAGARVAALTIPPRGNSKGWTPEKQAILVGVNSWIMGNKGGANHCIDAYAVLAERGTENLMDRYDGGDHVHLNGAGYNTLANIIYRNVRW